jgi:hypothetical protein
MYAACGQGRQLANGPVAGLGPMNSTHFLYSNQILTDLNLSRLIGGLPEFKKFKIKYKFIGN